MANRIFIDTSAFYAIIDKRDQAHSKAIPIWDALIESSDSELCVSNGVISETYTLIRYRLSFEIASEFLRIVGDYGILVFYSDTAVERNAYYWLEKYKDVKLSFVDAVSFQIMKEHKIKHEFTFDNHFEITGFYCLPLTSS